MKDTPPLNNNTQRWAYAFFILILTHFALAAKTDIVVLHNGDRITGEVKRLEFGMLTYKTDDAGTLSIKWDKITEIYANKQSFRVELEDGLLFFGTLNTDTSSHRLMVEFDTLRVRMDFSEIVNIAPIKRTFWSRIEISTDLGFNFTKSSDITQLNFSGNAKYRTYNFLHEINLSSIISIQKESEKKSERNSAGYTINRFLAQHWLQMGSLNLEQNTELGIELRLSGGGGIGRHLLQSNSEVFSAGGGVLVNREWISGSTDSQYNLEGVAALRFSKFRYDSPKLNLNSQLSVYPNLTTWGRVRSEIDITLKWEIIKDLYWNLQYYTSFDNQPPGGESAKIDYGIVVSFGWSKY